MEKILLHICCAPDATVAIKRLKKKNFEVIGFFYNPNIHPLAEYVKRLEETIKLSKLMNFELIKGEYDFLRYFKETKGLNDEKEGGKRCEICFKIRLDEVAKMAKKLHIKYFTTTLTISPHKYSPLIFSLGRIAALKYDLILVEENFKKENGFQESIQQSNDFSLYRQNYCGCVYSLRDRILYKRKKIQK